MTDAAKEARRAYKRQWAKDNPEKIRKYQSNYWTKKALEVQQAQQQQEAGVNNDI